MAEDIERAPFCQAAFAVGAVKYTFKFVHEMYLHSVCNQDDNCVSYGSHKYVSDERHAQLNALTGSAEGAGCYGSWSFRDGSKLYAMCNGSFVIYRPARDGEVDIPEVFYIEKKDPRS